MRERDPERLVRFATTFGIETRGSGAGKPVPWAEWQLTLLRELAASGARDAYIQLPRKNGKSAIGSIIALHGLCADGEQGAEVYSVASTADQARIVFNTAKRMIEFSSLSRHLKPYRNEIIHQASGSRYKVLAADAKAHEGLNPSLVIFDEVHALGSSTDLRDVMKLGMGTREFPLMLYITTPGVMFGSDGRPSMAHTLYQYGKQVASGEIDDPKFFFRAWEAPAGCEVSDRDAWATANPGLGDFLTIESMEDDLRKTHENEFRTKRLGQWVSAHNAWLPNGAWEACPVAIEPPDGTRVVLGFDGSKSRDATALIGATIEPEPQVFVVKVWERPMNAPLSWQVDRADVEMTLNEACAKWAVNEIVADPYLWVSELQEWANRGLPVVEMPQHPSRMVPATQRFYEAVTSSKVKHDGNKTLARHLANAVIKPNGQIAKEHKDSGRKIDAAVAAVMAYERAASLGYVRPRPRVYVV